MPGIVDRLQQGIDVVDIGCGSGHAVNLMAETYPLAASSVWTLPTSGWPLARPKRSKKG
ncbi:MAG: hypothetical protein ABWY12_15315 [Burkholderiales bacterium]